MSSPFQQKFMAKNPAKGFTLDQLKKASEKSQKEMVKNAEILNKQNPEVDQIMKKKKSLIMLELMVMMVQLKKLIRHYPCMPTFLQLHIFKDFKII
jgi:formate dehydrogenase maturation protein FdhE